MMCMIFFIINRPNVIFSASIDLVESQNMILNYMGKYAALEIFPKTTLPKIKGTSMYDVYDFLYYQ